MLSSLLAKLSDLPAIMQGAAGSALFWLLLKAFEYVSPRLLRVLGETVSVVSREKKTREYVYRRFTNMSGLVNYTWGFHYSIYRALRGLLTGLIFCSIALLLGGRIPVIYGIRFMAALVYFGEALTWLQSNAKWNSLDPRENWQRIADS